MLLSCASCSLVFVSTHSPPPSLHLTCRGSSKEQSSQSKHSVLPFLKFRSSTKQPPPPPPPAPSHPVENGLSDVSDL